MRWWLSGLVGAFTLCIASVIKACVAIPIALYRGTFDADFHGAVGLFAFLFITGFILGVMGWCGRGMYWRIGWVGDSLTGLAVMLVFFLCCMLVFDPEMLGSKFVSGGVPMFCLAAVLGVVFGPLFARDLRREFGHAADHADQRAG